MARAQPKRTLKVELSAETPTRADLKALVMLLRPAQWVKNLFVVAPLFFTPADVNGENIVKVLAGTALFCALASAVYIVNDYFDREADRKHPKKRSRPLAAGTIPISLAAVVMAVLALAGLGGAALLGARFFSIALAYFALNLGYSLWLKRVSILDVLLVALGFVLRIYAGGALIDVQPTVWITVCTGLLALFIALAKRRDDVARGLSEEHRSALAGYNARFLDSSIAIVLGALVVSYVMYTTDAANMARLGTDRLFMTTPFVIAGVLRYLQITIVEERSGNPTSIALTDRFMIVTVFGWLATFGWLIYR